MIRANPLSDIKRKNYRKRGRGRRRDRKIEREKEI
jgi:hypothetical protein